MRRILLLTTLALAAPVIPLGMLFLYGAAHERAMTACTSTPPGHPALPSSSVTVESSFPPWRFECVYWKSGRVVARTRADSP